MGLLLAACAASRAAPGADPGVLFQDDFSQVSSGWDVHTDSLITTNYDDGQYLIALNDVGKDVWALPGLDLTDVQVDVDTRYVAGPANNEFGVLCRYTRDGDKPSFYFFFASSDGYYIMGKVVKNKRIPLNPTDFQPTDAIQQDPSAVNHLTAICNGNQMSFAVNGTSLGSFEDTELTRGDIGLIVGTFDEGGVRIHFDNLVVRKP